MKIMQLVIRCAGLSALAAPLFWAVLPATAQPRTTVQAEAAFLKQLSGSWKGRGRLRRTLKANIEPISCRMDTALKAAAVQVKMSVTCLGLDLRFGTSGTLTFQPSVNRYAGTWYVTGQTGEAKGGGVRKGRQLSLALNGLHPKTGKPLQSMLSLVLSGKGRLVNRIRARDITTGKWFQILDITFAR